MLFPQFSLLSLLATLLLFNNSFGHPYHHPTRWEPCVRDTLRAARACGFKIDWSRPFTGLESVADAVSVPHLGEDVPIPTYFPTLLCSPGCANKAVCALQCITEEYAASITANFTKEMTLTSDAVTLDKFRFGLCTDPKIILGLDTYPGKSSWDKAEKQGIWYSAFNFKGSVTAGLAKSKTNISFNGFNIKRVGYSGRCVGRRRCRQWLYSPQRCNRRRRILGRSKMDRIRRKFRKMHKRMHGKKNRQRRHRSHY